jgi:hypothetical protein
LHKHRFSHVQAQNDTELLHGEGKGHHASSRLPGNIFLLPSGLVSTIIKSDGSTATEWFVFIAELSIIILSFKQQDFPRSASKKTVSDSETCLEGNEILDGPEEEKNKF